MNLPDCLVDHPDGEIRLTGSRIGLFHVVSYYNQGYSPEMLAEHFPTLPLGQIREVIAFYLENRAEVDAYVAECQAEIDRQRAAHPPGPGVLKIRRLLEERRQAGTP